MSKDPKKSLVLQIRLNPKQMREVKKAAKARGMSPSAFARERLFETVTPPPDVSKFQS